MGLPRGGAGLRLMECVQQREERPALPPWNSVPAERALCLWTDITARLMFQGGSAATALHVANGLRGDFEWGASFWSAVVSTAFLVIFA